MLELGARSDLGQRSLHPHPLCGRGHGLSKLKPSHRPFLFQKVRVSYGTTALEAPSFINPSIIYIYIYIYSKQRSERGWSGLLQLHCRQHEVQVAPARKTSRKTELYLKNNVHQESEAVSGYNSSLGNVQTQQDIPQLHPISQQTHVGNT